MTKAAWLVVAAVNLKAPAPEASPVPKLGIMLLGLATPAVNPGGAEAPLVP